jgi:hypothetical protein
MQGRKAQAPRGPWSIVAYGLASIDLLSGDLDCFVKVFRS